MTRTITERLNRIERELENSKIEMARLKLRAQWLELRMKDLEQSAQHTMEETRK